MSQNYFLSRLNVGLSVCPCIPDNHTTDSFYLMIVIEFEKYQFRFRSSSHTYLPHDIHLHCPKIHIFVYIMSIFALYMFIHPINHHKAYSRIKHTTDIQLNLSKAFQEWHPSIGCSFWLPYKNHIRYELYNIFWQ